MIYAQHDSANVNRNPTSTAGGSMEDNQQAEKRGDKKDRVIAPKPRAARRSVSVKDVMVPWRGNLRCRGSTLIHRLFERIQTVTAVVNNLKSAKRSAILTMNVYQRLC